MCANCRAAPAHDPHQPPALIIVNLTHPQAFRHRPGLQDHRPTAGRTLAATALASHLPAGTTRLVRLPGARHTIFRDRPDLAFPAVRNFAAQISESQHAS